MKKLLLVVALCVLAVGIVFFARNKTQIEPQSLRVGATPVPHAEILNLIKDDLKKDGVELEVIEFTDYVTPNIALNDKQIDANFFQHLPYLESFIKERGMNLVSLAGIHVEPFGVYSSKITDINDLKEGAIVAIPNDPTNEGRALLLLQSHGIITLNPNAGLEATPADIAENPLKLSFRELDAAQLPRALRDVDIATINGNYALEAKLNPLEDALIIEGADSPYVNIIAIRADMVGDPRLQALVEALKSEKVKQYMIDNYDGGVVAVF